MLEPQLLKQTIEKHKHNGDQPQPLVAAIFVINHHYDLGHSVEAQIQVASTSTALLRT